MIELKVMTPTDDTIKVVGRLKEGIKNLNRPMKEIGLYMMKSMHTNIKQGGRPEKWAPLSKLTVFGRKHGGGVAQPLQDTGMLINSISMETGEGYVKVGTKVPYAKWQHYGTRPYVILPKNKKSLRFKVGYKDYKFAKKIRHPGIPARPFVVIRDEDERMIMKILGDYIDGAMVK